jgi:hypothetical protein
MENRPPRIKVYTQNLNIFLSPLMMDLIKTKTTELGYPSLSVYVRRLLKDGLSRDIVYEE